MDTTEYLTVRGVENAFAGGEHAQVPDGNGGYYPPNAQNAVRQAPVLADNIIATLRGKELKPYRHKNLGAVAGLGMYKGAAQVFGAVKLTGLPAWLAHRSYHLLAVPTFNRKMRVLADWTLGFFLRRDFASIPEMSQPRQAFTEAPARKSTAATCAASPEPRHCFPTKKRQKVVDPFRIGTGPQHFVLDGEVKLQTTEKVAW